MALLNAELVMHDSSLTMKCLLKKHVKVLPEVLSFGLQPAHASKLGQTDSNGRGPLSMLLIVQSLFWRKCIKWE